MVFKRVATLSDLWSGEMLAVGVAGKKVLLINLEEKIYAYEDKCAHLGVALSEGHLKGQTLTCGAHCWEYDICTGRGRNPATARLRAFAVRVDNGEILVDVDQARPADPRPFEGPMVCGGDSKNG